MATKPAPGHSSFAPAKVNLALHVTGQRGDGYHLLDSLVCFADVGDLITVAPSDDLTLTITGPHAAGLPLSDDNLVLRAARALHPARGARITLTKNLPIASGIGGGSADAAATLHALAALWALPLPDVETVLRLGADVPVCLTGHAARMQGIGETVTPLTLPAGWLVLVNCGVPVATGAVFAALRDRHNPPLPDKIPDLPDTAALASLLSTLRNDLQIPAMALCPAIATVIDALAAQPGCLLTRMSGSGATCFGLFSDPTLAHQAASALQTARPTWWVAACALHPAQNHAKRLTT